MEKLGQKSAPQRTFSKQSDSDHESVYRLGPAPSQTGLRKFAAALGVRIPIIGKPQAQRNKNPLGSFRADEDIKEKISGVKVEGVEVASLQAPSGAFSAGFRASHQIFERGFASGENALGIRKIYTALKSRESEFKAATSGRKAVLAAEMVGLFATLTPVSLAWNLTAFATVIPFSVGAGVVEGLKNKKG